ncbi:cysteine-rich secretory family protein [Pelomyxa schiedti]|nr:cysteine-rich secretory family protein [Pelomyxa schiedti]
MQWAPVRSILKLLGVNNNGNPSAGHNNDSKKRPEQSSFAEKTTKSQGDVRSRGVCGQALRMGLEVLAHTNEYRQKLGMKPMVWHHALASIGQDHSIRMADGKVPLGHDGFDDRVKQFPFHSRRSAENVAMIPDSSQDVCYNTTDCEYSIVNSTNTKMQRAVKAWIKSPGHRRNLEGSFDFCGIGLFLSRGGNWFFTQLFAS